MATPRQLVARLNETRGHGWVYDARTRGAYNVVTQDRVSRRQLDKMEGGRLAAEGFSSYEAKAKARAQEGLKGFRQVRPGVFEKVVTRKGERKQVLRQLHPTRTRVKMLVRGDDPHRFYRDRRRRGAWRTMNFVPEQGPARPMTPQDLLSVWDKRAGKAGKVIGNPDRWVIRVTVPK